MRRVHITMKIIHNDAMRSFPPFDGLIAFEAALRHASVTRASAELGLTQSAVSHRLRKLEDFVGMPLLVRQPSGLSATPAGIALSNELAGLLDRMADFRALCRAAAPPPALRVGVGAALADYWLVRRLPEFAEACPGIPVELVIIQGDGHVRSADLDVKVLWQPAAGLRPTSTQRLLFREQVYPVCHPRLLPGRRPLTDVTRLRSLPLLHKGRAGEDSGAEWSWTTWFERLGLGRPPPAEIRFATIATAIAAALAGNGIVLARSLLVRDAIRDGRLLRVLPPSWDLPSSKTQIVHWAPAMANDARVKAFVNWILQLPKTPGD
ncbi:LysR substrate-binding domain-containing protein [Bradyrhizobium liaoningense]|uniref:LysR substrate-binding domain-containing protein n=1 Tax=Bradyrhizobium liaoningense TaxID=43992 RepID=UPI001FD2F975|nr:LysR substrate-binding domain-containing protein [Bradyrhizobium liaoningense]